MKDVRKVLKLSDLRKLQNFVDTEVITESKMIEIINHAAYFEYVIEPYAKCEHFYREPSIQRKADHVTDLIRWDSKKYESAFEKGMMKPNPPNYLRANND